MKKGQKLMKIDEKRAKTDENRGKRGKIHENRHLNLCNLPEIRRHSMNFIKIRGNYDSQVSQNFIEFRQCSTTDIPQNSTKYPFEISTDFDEFRQISTSLVEF